MSVIECEPGAVVFRCADAVVAGEVFFGREPGSVIEVSTLGLVLDAGVLAGIEYAVDTLEVPTVVVLGHTGCHAMAMANRAWADGRLPDGAARTVIESLCGVIARRGTGAAPAAHVTEIGTALLERSPLIASRVAAGRCAIICATVDQADGSVRTHATLGPVGRPAEALPACG